MDEVLGERINTETGKKEYLISYVGFGPESNIWLPIQALNPEARKSVFLKFPKVTKIKAKKIVPEKKSISAEMASTTLPVRRSARHQPPWSYSIVGCIMSCDGRQKTPNDVWMI